MLQIGSPAPEISLKDQTGTSRTLSEFRGSYVLVYFYPKDDTAGCTKEACVIRDMYGEFDRLGVQVLGISADSVESHKAFAEKYGLPFTLLSDPTQETISAYGAKGLVMSKRISYLVNPSGTVAKAYPNVDPTTHGGEILNGLYILTKKVPATSNTA